MSVSLFIEHHANGLAFYINGDLQFDTADEAIYHEYLVVPAIALAVQRFPNKPLRVLICGGGDGLAARDALRFQQVTEIALVDYDPEVLELGRTVFKPYNQGSLVEERTSALGGSRITVHTQEAFQFISQLPDACYHVVLCDFTFPTCAQDAGIYSQEWFQQVNRVLLPGGVMSTNGVSPEHRTQGFWCLYQTLLSAQLHAKPMQVAIPSFRNHGYGDWGFFLASNQAIAQAELAAMALPNDLQAVQPEQWLQAFAIRASIAGDRHTVYIHTLQHPQLFYYLLNPIPAPALAAGDCGDGADPLDAAEWVDFLAIQETGTGTISPLDLLQLDSMVQVWLGQLRQGAGDRQTPADFGSLIPVQHRYQSPGMTQEWMGYLKSLLAEIDLNQLLSSLLERTQELPPHLARELKKMGEKIRTGKPLLYISEHTTELITILSVTLIMANLAAPDSVFAKGFVSSGSRSSHYGSNSGSDAASCYDVEGNYVCDDGNFGWFGFWMMIIGGFWLSQIYRNPNRE